jgi:hypothetical protein
VPAKKAGSAEGDQVRDMQSVQGAIRKRLGLREDGAGRFALEASLRLSVELSESYGEAMLRLELSGLDGSDERVEQALAKWMFMPDGPGTRYTYLLRPQSEQDLELVLAQLAEIVADLRSATTRPERS